jgi:adenylate cyclase
VRVISGGDALHAPSTIEHATLIRIGAPVNVRLACQIRPSADLAVEPLVHAAASSQISGARYDAAVEGGKELEIVACFVDLRESTRLANGKLPYDALFIFDRYIQVVTSAVRQNKGHVTSIAGDGVMSVFGAEGDALDATHAACTAVLQIWSALDALNDELAAELSAPLRVGIGLHLGTAVVGMIRTDEQRSLQFLGDTGNIAAKLEQHTKQLDCVVVASASVLAQLKNPLPVTMMASVSIADRDIPVGVFREQSELRRLLTAT